MRALGTVALTPPPPKKQKKTFSFQTWSWTNRANNAGCVQTDSSTIILLRQQLTENLCLRKKSCGFLKTLRKLCRAQQMINQNQQRRNFFLLRSIHLSLSANQIPPSQRSCLDWLVFCFCFFVSLSGYGNTVCMHIFSCHSYPLVPKGSKVPWKITLTGTSRLWERTITHTTR